MAISGCHTILLTLALALVWSSATAESERYDDGINNDPEVTLVDDSKGESAQGDDHDEDIDDMSEMQLGKYEEKNAKSRS